MKPKTQNPLVSVGMPVYNGAKTLRRALDSILEQDYPNLELIISDNASTDETSKVCREYASRDSRIVYYRAKKNMGASWNFNHALKLSKGKYFMWAAHDDLRLPTYISKCVNQLERNEKAVLCQSYTVVSIEGSEKPLYVATLDTIACITCPIKRFSIVLKFLSATAIYGLIRTETAKKIKPLGNYLSTDIVFIHELSLYGEFSQVSEKLFYYFGRETRRNTSEDFELLRPGNKLPQWYFPFVVVALNHAISILRSPLSPTKKIVLIGILMLHEAKIVAAKIALRFVAKIPNSNFPHCISKIIDQAMFYNPNIKWLANDSEIPLQHQAFSKRMFQ